MLNEYKSVLRQLINQVIKIYSDHQLILKKLGHQMLHTSSHQNVIIWEIRIKQRLHIHMKKELRESLTSKSIWDNEEVYRQFNEIDNDHQSLLDDQHMSMSPRTIAHDIVQKINRMNTRLHLPIYIKDLLEEHANTLCKVYPETRGHLRIV